MFKEDTLKGKTILVTGGGSGLGLAMAIRFAELGARVAICGRTEEKLQKAIEEIRQKGAEARYYVCDVRDFQQVDAMVARALSDFGEVNGLVNNAAGNFLAPTEELSPNGFRAVVDIVLQGTFNCTRALGKHWIDNGIQGTILNIVTTYAETGSAFVVPSAAAKAGVLAMTRSLAYEWAEFGIRINAIAPGPFPTEGAWKRLMPSKEFEDFYLKKHPMHRYGEKWELTNLAVFLISDLAPYLTGESIAIDGAEHLQGGQFNFITQLMPRKQLKSLFQQLKGKK